MQGVNEVTSASLTLFNLAVQNTLDLNFSSCLAIFCNYISNFCPGCIIFCKMINMCS